MDHLEIAFKDLVENAPQAIAVHRNFDLLYYNKAAEMLFWRGDPNAAPKIKRADLLIAPEEIPRVSRYMEQRLKGEDVPEFYEFEGRRLDDSRLWLAASVKLITWEGEPAHQVAFVDLTERKEAEEAALAYRERFLQQLMDTTTEGYWFIGPDGKTVDVNASMCRILGRPQAQILGKTIYDFVDDENAEIFRSELAARQKGKTGTYEIALRRSDGQNIPCLNNATPIYDETGARVGSIGLWTDLSALKEAQVKLEKAKAEAENANMAKSVFLANISHELRTPLNAVLGFADTIRSEILGPVQPKKYAEYAADIYTAGSHLLSLINELLDLAKIEAGEYPTTLDNLSFFDVFNEALMMVNGRAQEKGLKLTINIPVGLPDIKVDRRSTKQALINILNNGIKFTATGGEITVCAAVAGDMLRVTITDTGVGMTQEDLQRALEPFVQIEREKGGAHEGTGLGLPLSKQLLEKQGGSLTLSSNAGEGTSAVLLFPLAEA